MTYNTTQPVNRYDTIPQGTVIYSTQGETIQNEEPANGIISFVNEFKQYVPELSEYEDVYKYIKAYINRPTDVLAADATTHESSADLEAMECVGTLYSIGQTEVEDNANLAEDFENFRSSLSSYNVSYTDTGSKTDTSGRNYRMMVFSTGNDSDTVWRMYYRINDGYVIINQEIPQI